jgi:hypothetical protein
MRNVSAGRFSPPPVTELADAAIAATVTRKAACLAKRDAEFSIF